MTSFFSIRIILDGSDGHIYGVQQMWGSHKRIWFDSPDALLLWLQDKGPLVPEQDIEVTS